MFAKTIHFAHFAVFCEFMAINIELSNLSVTFFRHFLRLELQILSKLYVVLLTIQSIILNIGSILNNICDLEFGLFAMVFEIDT